MPPNISELLLQVIRVRMVQSFSDYRKVSWSLSVLSAILWNGRYILQHTRILLLAPKTFFCLPFYVISLPSKKFFSVFQEIRERPFSLLKPYSFLLPSFIILLSLPWMCFSLLHDWGSLQEDNWCSPMLYTWGFWPLFSCVKKSEHLIW